MTQSFADLPDYFLEHLCQYMDTPEYLQFTSTCKSIAQIRHSKTLNKNGYFRMARVFDLVFNQRRNVLMHGPAGCGKSFSLNALHKAAQERKLNIAMTSTTGVSSQRLPEGMTIHSFSKLGKGSTPLAVMQQKPLYMSPKRFKGRYSAVRNTDILVIDEISMLGARFLEKLEWVFRTVREDPRPFGGLVLVFCGDFMQLPPVMDKFAFTGDAWGTLNLNPVIFDIPYRQSGDMSYYWLLQRLRRGEALPRDVGLLKKCVKPDDKKHVLDVVEGGNEVLMEFVDPYLMSTNREVRATNDYFFQHVSHPITHTRMARDEWMERINEGKNQIRWEPCAPIPIPESTQRHVEHGLYARLDLKPGAQYFLTHNLSVKKGLVNGSLCIYFENVLGDGYLHFENGIEIPVEAARVKKSFCILNSTFLFRTQLALRMGYASTIHGSQGMTMDRAIINLGRTVFAASQAYVALSRVRTSKTLHLLEFLERSLRVSKQAKAFVDVLEGNSS